MKHSWEKQPHETAKSYQVFCRYRDMGSDRSLEKARLSLGKNSGYLRHLHEWSSKYKWVSRANAYDDYLEQKTRLEWEASLTRKRIEHMEAEYEHANLLRQKGLEMFEYLSDKPLTQISTKKHDRSENGQIVESVETVFKPTDIITGIRHNFMEHSRLGRRALRMPLDSSKLELEIEVPEQQLEDYDFSLLAKEELDTFLNLLEKVTIKIEEPTPQHQLN